MNYKRLNNIVGWLVFLIATTVYFITAEETASLWDCGEFITTAYKLEVGHPPGAPLFMLIGRIFSLFASSPMEVAHWVNWMSALSSSFTILFLFWSITMLGRKIAEKDNAIMSKGQEIAIIGSGVVGALAYTFTESFWFSAVEGEVYAMASLFTAIIFWAALKWDAETTQIRRGELTPDVHPLRWMVLIMFLIGLAIGVHLLGLLVLPAIAYIVSHQYYEKLSLKNFVVTGVVGLIILVFVQEGIIPKTIAMASKFEIFFRDSMGLPFHSGAMFFFILIIGILAFGLIYTQRKNYKIMNTAMLGLVMLLIGYGSFATIVIRSNANPPLDENDPENLVTLHSYLKREQYGSWPILYGPHFNSKEAKRSEFLDASPNYDRRWVVTTGANKTVVSSFKLKADAEAYIASHEGKYEMDERYFMTNEKTREKRIAVYAQNTLFPRMYVTGDQRIADGYKKWSGYDPTRRGGEMGADRKPLPTMANNIAYMVNYQMGWMYWRYFMWNFAGRQNDIQGHGDELRGNWISGFSVVDDMRLGAQGENSPYFTQKNSSNYRFFFLPIILGLIGMFFHFLKSPKDAIVVSILFILTGIAIIFYLNQKPFEPRERDYAYAASFYTFAIWIGLGVYGLFEAFRSFAKKEYMNLLIGYGALFLLCMIADLSATRGMPATVSILIIGAIGFGAMALMTALRKANFSTVGAAGIATILGLAAPILMGFQNWEGHDRSNRTSTRDLAYNYLVSCSPNSILYTNGDNDTFPLWYAQEVEGFGTDVRVANLSLMQTDWYTNQMKMRAYESDPLPIKFREDQILMGAGFTDYAMLVNLELFKQNLPKDKTKEIMTKKIEANKTEFRKSINQIRTGIYSILPGITTTDSDARTLMERLSVEFENPLENPTYDDYESLSNIMLKLVSDSKNKKITLPGDMESQLEMALTTWVESWDYLPLDYAMEYLRDDNNMYNAQNGVKIRIFPATGFVLPVNVENCIKAEIFPEEYADDALSVIRFDFRRGGLFREDVEALTREELMMLDVLANADWTRGIFFSSPGGSNLAKALYAEGLLANFGQVHGLVPLNSNALQDFGREKMYENLMVNYRYGNLNADGVLVDYYTRRHTEQYRNNFSDLANQYLRKYKDIMSITDFDTTFLNNHYEEPSYYADKIEEIIRYSLKQLPISKVFDFGEPRAMGQTLPNGESLASDGSIPEMIAILYHVEKDELANELAMEYFGQLETMVNYFAKSHWSITYNNRQDFVAFATNFFRVYSTVLMIDPNSTVSEYGNILDKRLTQDIIVKVDGELRAQSRGKSSPSEKKEWARKADDFLILYNSILEHYGFETELEL